MQIYKIRPGSGISSLDLMVAKGTALDLSIWCASPISLRSNRWLSGSSGSSRRRKPIPIWNPAGTSAKLSSASRNSQP